MTIRRIEDLPPDLDKKISHLFKNCPCKIINDFTQIENLDYYQHLLTLQYIHFKIENNFKKCIPYITSNNEIDLNWKNKLEIIDGLVKLKLAKAAGSCESIPEAVKAVGVGVNNSVIP